MTTSRDASISIEEDTETQLESPLPAEDLDALNADSRISVSLNTDGHVLIHPGRYIGLVGLPSGRVIEITPKVDLDLLYSLAYAGWIDETLFRGQDVGIETGTSFVDILAHLFITEVDRILRRGLYQEYQTRAEMQRYLKGRLDINRQLTVNGPYATQFACEFDELTSDLPINHVLVQATEALLPLVSTGRLESDLQRTQGRLRQQLDVIPREHIDPSAISLTRQNSHYRKALMLCALILSKSYVEDLGVGSRDFQSILLSTSELFENLVYRAVERCLDMTQYQMDGDGDPDRRERRDVGSLLWSTQDASELQKLHPDVFITERSTGAYVLIGDAKWKDPESGRPSSGDLYQMTAYQTKTDAPVLLVYPGLEGVIEDSYTYLRPGSQRGSESFQVCELDVGGATSYEGFKRQLHSAIQPAIDRLLGVETLSDVLK